MLDDFGEEVLRVSMPAYFIKLLGKKKKGGGGGGELRHPISHSGRGMIEFAVDKASVANRSHD